VPWRGPQRPGEFPTLGYEIARWIESTLLIPDGQRAGQAFRLTDEQYMHLLHAHRLRPDVPGDAPSAMAHCYRGSVLVRGQKWGKDPFNAARCLAAAFGPTEFAGWDAKGEPVGRAHPSPWVAIAATNEQQTDNTWLPLQAMIRTSSLASEPGVQVNLDQVILPSGTPIEPLPATAFGRLGGRFTFVSITESGLLVGDGKRGGLTFGRTLKRNVGGMGGLWSEISNPWDPAEDSLLKLQVEAHRAGQAPDVYVDYRRSRRSVPLDDDEALLAELEYLYGDSSVKRGGWVVCERILGDIKDPSMGESEVRRFYLQEEAVGSKPFIEPAMWDARAALDAEPLGPGDTIALGFDGSRSHDATALIAYRLRDACLFVLGLWVPAEEDGGVVPRPAVDASVRAAFAAYNVAAMYCDPYRWQDYLDKWRGQYGKRVVEFATAVPSQMDKAIERFRTSILAGELAHDGDPRLSLHVRNAALTSAGRRAPRESESGSVTHYLKLAKRGREGLIDAAVAAVLAVHAGGEAERQPVAAGPIRIEGSLIA
jgi:hypothetical protein